MNKTVKNFNLHIEKASGQHAFAAVVRDARGKVLAANGFRYKIDASIFTSLEDSVGRNISGNANRIRGFGSDLFSAVFKGDLHEYYKSQRSTHARMKLCFRGKDPELLRIPWEFMFDGEYFLSAHPTMTMTRVLGQTSRKRKRKITGKLKLLAVLSSPLDLPKYYSPHNEREQTIMLEAAGSLDKAGRMEMDFLDRASLSNIRKRLSQGGCHIIHFTGHGIYSQKEQACYVLLEDDFGNAHPADNETIADLLSVHSLLRLVVLSGCQTAVSAVGHRVLGDLPAALLAKDIPAVIAMQYSVTDRSAMDLAREFYAGLCMGLPIDRALANAKMALLSKGGEGLVDFGASILYADNPDALFPKASSRGNK